MDYTISEIRLTDRRGQAAVDALLASAGLGRDARLDYVCGVYDEEDTLRAVGCCSGNTLRCMACDPDCRGKGLMNRIVSHLTEVQTERGNSRFFLYTKPESSVFFRDLGFYAIASTDTVTFMENRKNGFQNYLTSLVSPDVRPPSGSFPALCSAESRGSMKSSAAVRERISGIVMNASPFTLGHRYLIETALRESEAVHVFVLSEDNGPISAADRLFLVRQGTSDLENVFIHETGPYMISGATFPEYFLKERSDSAAEHARLDIAVFLRISKHLGINTRFAGEEPFSPVTALYNSVMAAELPKHGIAFRVIPRLETPSGIISAGAVRKAASEGHMELLTDMVPPATLKYLKDAGGSSL